MILEPKKKIAVARHIEKIIVGTRLRNLDEAKVLSFMDSIKAVGLKTPITVYGDEADASVRLSAGGHRLEACTRLGMSTILCFHEQGDDTDRELWEIDENLIRSDLSVAERALFMARRKELHLIKYPETAKGVAQALASNAAQGRGGQVVRDAKSFAAATAEATGRDERSIRRDVERGEKISKSAIQQLIGTRHNNGVTLDHLKKIETPEAQESYVRALLAADKAVQAESKLVRTAQQKQNRESRLNLIGAIAEHGRRNSMAMPRAAYAVGYADPAWPQDAWSEETGQDKGLKYPSMSVDEIKALCAGDRSPFTRDARLYLWTTSNRMKIGIEVLEAWGFELCTVWTWDKEDMGMGFELRDQTEHLLIGKRGNFPAPTPGEQPRSLYREKKGPHSRKPVYFAQEIDRLWPNLRKLELFQRKDSLAEGDIRLNGMWDFWGNQAGTPEGGAA
ncbi:MT-A70 family methyltransferase [Agrobacterium sp. LAD9]|uniref:MT-A70 family methyltransferase n=1 Tax=Agrobacterium sp. LAD9 TaxID=2055153 RepID=UPI000D1EDBEB|nr:MT-A70 family methyltransferase [Agrobacterium sp. LAD9]